MRDPTTPASYWTHGRRTTPDRGHARYVYRRSSLSPRRPTPSTIETAPWRPEGWISAKDAATAVKLACCLIAALTPVRHWPAAARLMARAHLRIHDRSVQILAASNAFPAENARARAEAAFAEDYLWNIRAIREALPGGWQCETPLAGRAILDRALQRSRGAVLWCSPFVGSDLAPKKALAEYRLTHLSSPSHPFSPTRFGTLVLNPLRLRAVNPYLVRRVLVVYGNSRPALDVMKQVLANNGVVLIMAVGTGKRSLTFPFLGGTIDLAVGAPRLAHATGSALIPVATLPHQNGYRVELGPDLAVPNDFPEQDAVAQMTSRYVELLEPLVRAYPAHWEGWFHPGTWRPNAA